MDDLSKKQDKELVELLKSGSQLAFEQLYIRHSNNLTNTCRRFLKSKTDAEDIVHDIFLQIWETRESLNTELSFSGFLNKLAQNSVLQKFRKADVHSRFLQYMKSNGIDATITNETENEIIENDYTKLLNELMEKLPPQQREAFRLNRIEGLTYKEIAELMQISTENARKHVSLALKEIKKHLSLYTGIDFQILVLILILLY